jgi:hypothetical protein
MVSQAQARDTPSSQSSSSLVLSNIDVALRVGMVHSTHRNIAYICTAYRAIDDDVRWCLTQMKVLIANVIDTYRTGAYIHIYIGDIRCVRVRGARSEWGVLVGVLAI